jgi:hypothetical protein
MCLDGLLCDEFDQKDVVFVNAVVRRMQTKNLIIMVIQILKRRSSIVVLIYTKVKQRIMRTMLYMSRPHRPDADN